MVTLKALVGMQHGSGHGECFVWHRSQDDSVVSIDAGGSADVGLDAATYFPKILVLSHSDSDHIKGAKTLITHSIPYLKELWVPADWIHLLKTIASSAADAPFRSSEERLELTSLTQVQASTAPMERLTNESLLLILRDARTVLLSWSALREVGTREFQTNVFMVKNTPDSRVHVYGADSFEEVLIEVTNRSDALAEILETATAEGITIRFFSIDQAIADRSKPWLTAGEPGTATIVNATEVWNTPVLGTGLPLAFALARLTVQNRRALCTFLWTSSMSLRDGVVIWSDTDGNWIDLQHPSDFRTLVGALACSSAPHHASANAAHDRVWNEIKYMRDDAVYICAGGMWRQHYRKEYISFSDRRCCTRCRRTNPKSPLSNEVSVSIGPTGIAALNRSCALRH